MAKKRQTKSSPLRDQIEREVIEDPPIDDAEFEDVEDFVPGLVKEISQGLPLPKTDLKSVESAQKAITDLNKKLAELKAYHHRVHTLRDLLLQKKHALVSSQDFQSKKKVLPEKLD